MGNMTMEVRMALMVGILPIVGVLLWFWNDIWFAIPVRLRGVADGTELPAGYMGIPFLGEMCTFLWYFKFLKCPDEFIDCKEKK